MVEVKVVFKNEIWSGQEDETWSEVILYLLLYFKTSTIPAEYWKNRKLWSSQKNSRSNREEIFMRFLLL